MRAIEIVEVGPRDGLQNESVLLSTADKVDLIVRSVAAGIGRIEVASFVHPGRVPQMADAEAVCASLPALDGVTAIGLVLNMRGARRALATRVDEFGAVVSASDGFGMANQGRTSDQTVADAVDILRFAREHGRQAQVTISVAFGCPFEGEIEPARVADLARRVAVGGPVEIALADTIGVAAPTHVARVIAAVRAAVPSIALRCHFHDTRNTAVANAWMAVECGVATLDSAIGGIGGCPFAPGSTGNVATEDLLYMLDRANLETGISLAKIVETSKWLGGVMGKNLPSRLAQVSPFPPRREER